MGTCTFEDESMQQASAKDYWCSLSALFKHSVINFVQKKFSLYLELFGGHQFESSKYFTYRKTLRTFRGAPVKKDTLYHNDSSFTLESTTLVQSGGEVSWQCKT